MVMIELWGRVCVWFGAMSKNKQIQFFDPQMNLPIILINTINLKLFFNHGRIYRFWKKIKKGTGKINPLGFHRNMR